MNSNFSFEEDEDWDLDLIQDLVRKEEEAIAAKKYTQKQQPQFPSSYGEDFASTYHENDNNNNSNNNDNNVHSPGLDSYLYSFSPPRGFTDSSKTKASTAQLGIRYNNSTQPGFQNKNSAQVAFQNNNSTQLGFQNTKYAPLGFQNNSSTSSGFQDDSSTRSGFQNNSTTQPAFQNNSCNQLRFQNDDSAQLVFQNNFCSQSGFQFDRPRQESFGRTEELGISSQPDKNVSLLKKEVDRLSEQLIFQDQEKLELFRDRDEKEQKLRRALESLAAKEAELELLKKTRVSDSIPTSKRGRDCNPGQEEELPCGKRTRGANSRSDADAILTSKRGHDCNPGQEEELPCGKRTRGASSRSDADAIIINLSYNLRSIWDPAENGRWETNIVSKLFVLCGMDIYALLSGTRGSNHWNSKVSNDMVCNDLSEGGHMVNGDKDIEAEKLHALSLNLHAILAKLANAVAPVESLIETLLEFCTLRNVEIVESALRLLNSTLRHECSFSRETAESGNFQGYTYRGISGHLDSLHKRSNERLQSQDSNKLASDDTINVDDCMFPQTFSSRIFFCNRSLGKRDWKAARNTGLDTNMPLVNEANSDKQMLTTAHEGCSPHIVNWVTLFKKICEVALDSASTVIKLQAISTMNLIVMKSRPDSEREQYGQILFYRSLSEFLRKKVGVDVQLQAVQLLFLLLNCPRLFKLFCGCKEDIQMHIENNGSNLDVSCMEGTNEMVLQGLVECISRTGYDMQVYTLRRRALHVLAFIAASGNMGIECLLNFTHSGSNNLQEQKICIDSGRSDGLYTENTGSHNSASVKNKNVHAEHCVLQSSDDVQRQRPNILLLLVALLNSEIDEEEKDVAKVDNAVEGIHKERATLVREALILLHSLACNPAYEASVLQVLTNSKSPLRLSLSVVQRTANRSFIYSRSGGVQMAETNQSDTMELAKELQQKILSHARDVW